MSEDVAEQLVALGHVGPPTDRALEQAREVLWAAVADEAISGGEAGGATAQRARPAGSTQQVDRHLEGPAS